jgi:hypothetical protein
MAHLAPCCALRHVRLDASFEHMFFLGNMICSYYFELPWPTFDLGSMLPRLITAIK